MKRDSTQLAEAIATMMDYQAGKEIQYKSRYSSSEPWITASKDGGLSFNWSVTKFRTKPQLREGFIFEESLHQHPSDHKWKKGDGTCFPVREVDKK